jgi:hypothetical protein
MFACACGKMSAHVSPCMWVKLGVIEVGGLNLLKPREREREREYAWRMAGELSGYRAQRRKVLFSGFECMCVLPCCFASETWYMVTYRQNLKCIGCVYIDLTNRPHHGLHPQSSGLLQIHVHYICASKY